MTLVSKNRANDWPPNKAKKPVRIRPSLLKIEGSDRGEAPERVISSSTFFNSQESDQLMVGGYSSQITSQKDILIPEHLVWCLK